MNQPIEDRIKHLEEEQEAIKRRLEKQETEPIKIDHLEIDRGGTHKRLDTVQEDVGVLKDDVGVLKIEMAGARADILQIRESQADQRDKLKEHGQHLEAIRTQQERNTETLGQLINVGESHTTRFDRIDTRLEATATKDDITRLEGLITQLLQQKQGE